MSVVLSAESVSKQFRIHHSRPSTLRESLVRRMTGQHDPGRSLWALRDVSFEVSGGQTLGVIGRNGAGKSTLLRLLCGIGRPTSGTIHRHGEVSGLLELGSGFHQLMTGRENIRTAGLLSGLTRRQVERLEKEMIQFAELEDFIDEPVRTYSSGMHLRLAFSAAIYMNPDVLIIDEVFAVGDENFRQKCLGRLDQFRRAGKTLILASHELGQIEKTCDEAIVLEEGRLEIRSRADQAVELYQELLRKKAEERAAEFPESATTQQPEYGRRIGTLEACITGVRFYNANGVLVRSVESDAGLIIEMDVQLIKQLSDFALAVAIFNESNVKCLEVNIPSIRSITDTWNGNSKFQCHIPNLPLLPGHYYANVGIYPPDWHCIYDYHWQMHPFRIVGDVPNVAGIVSVRPVWSKP